MLSSNEINSIDLLSDQASCHNIYNEGYCPQRLAFEERARLLDNGCEAFSILATGQVISCLRVVEVAG